jgi:hypothetical protein
MISAQGIMIFELRSECQQATTNTQQLIIQQ